MEPLDVLEFPVRNRKITFAIAITQRVVSNSLRATATVLLCQVSTMTAVVVKKFKDSRTGCMVPAIGAGVCCPRALGLGWCADYVEAGRSHDENTGDQTNNA